MITATVAKLTTGVKRFTLPDEFNHIVILKAVIARGGETKRQALESLINERMNRHQYSQADDLLREMLKLAIVKDDRQGVQARIDQIEKNWMQIESTSVQPAGKGATLDIRYRNGNKATFEARPIKIDELLADVRKYIESKPQQLDGVKLQIDNKDNKDGNEARIVLWVADTAISRKRVEDGTMYFVADAVTGAPIARADLEFFGWRQEYRQNQNYEIFTSRFAARTDADGLNTPDPKDLIPQNQWIVIARTKQGRLAYDGFMNVWNPEKLQPLDYSPLKVYSI